MFPVNMTNTATITPTDFRQLIMLAIVALDENKHPLAKVSQLTVEQLQELAALCYFIEYDTIEAGKVQITVNHIDTGTPWHS